ncbi:SulP family inorganic anion transporter [Blautia sp. MSJ-19]|uniref:SulP family inorganic anion transporter n=1 Tax=Blautia sp. MSJ-19 TaxID=2841517 RepID=UPI001C0EDD7A|nr:SulP family inorganic anion transporter [Blautia sp. MSJ-19]MBU5479673.1 STAS domain-containing protein [Blautia sp. MSJ-19]
MKLTLFPTLKNYNLNHLPRDIFSGIIIAAVSIPISMGYAQISGIPAIYGLYGSVFPILFFALFSTSKQFIFGVDAAPAAIVGSALASLGIAAESADALYYVPMIALFAGLWLLLFYFLHADRMVDFISTPVMGGFISGISLTIICMQIPKLLGGSAGSGEIIELLQHIFLTCRNINWLSLGLGIGALLLIRLSKKIFPKFPVAVMIMALGVLCTVFFHIDQHGVILLQSVEPGLPTFVLPHFGQVQLTQVIGRGLMVAVVIMAETLLAENNFAFKNDYKLNDRQEILACAAGNISAAFVGCCPVNGSISRTSMNEQYGGSSQAVSLTAGIVMAVLLSGFTGFIGYLPVPVLTAIVISALMDVVEVHLAVRLYKVSRNEFYIFMAACISVLFLGTIYGVVIGILLSFTAVILKATNPPRSFRGIIPGKEAYYDLKRNPHAYPIRHVVIYRFSENLFFANIKIFQEDLENSLKDDTQVVIVDAASVNSIDITAADRLESIAANMQKRGIRFYITEHASTLNDQMRALGIGHLIKDGCVRRTILAALNDAGIQKPYDLEIPEAVKKLAELRSQAHLPAEEENTLEEFAWAFGNDTVEELEKATHQIIEHLHQMPDVERLSAEGLQQLLDNWHSLGALDEDEILRRIELHIDELPLELHKDHRHILDLIEKRRTRIHEKMLEEHPELAARLEQNRKRLEERLEKQNPEAMRKWKEWKKREH